MAELGRGRTGGFGTFARKAFVAVSLAGAAAAVSRFRAGPPGEATEDSPRGRLAAALTAAVQSPVLPADIRPAGDAGTAPGLHTLFFTAREPGATSADVYRTAVQLAENGAPLRLSAPVDVTRTPDSDEHLLDAAGGRVLFSNTVRGKPLGAVVLDFDNPQAPDVGWGTRLVLAVGAWQSYGTLASPTRTDVILDTPAGALTGRLTEQGLVLTQDEHLEIVVDVAAGHITPDAVAHLERGSAPPVELLALLADALRSSAVVGTARVVALEAAVFDVRDWLLRLRHELFPTDEDRLPVAPTVTTVPTGLGGWPPVALQVPHEEAVVGEGEWVDPLVGVGRTNSDPDGPMVMRTFLRVDPERPYERVVLFAFDMRRLGLHFVGGTEDPRSTTGVRGQGTVLPGDRKALLACFNGGFKVEHGVFGAVEPGRVLVPPGPGLATVAIDAGGRARFGVWDAGPEVPPDVSALRQNLPPLLAGGVVNPQRTRNWGQLVARLDDTQTPRSAIGVTESGVLLFAWARASSAESLGEAMRRAGATFAMHLDMNPSHTGLELYGRDDAGEALPLAGAPEMDFRERRWLGTDPRDFFYLTATARELRPTSEPQDLGVATPEGPDAPVRLWRLDAVRPQVIPGLAEPAPAQRGGVAPRVVKLRAAPVFWIDTGLRATGDRYGLVVGGRVWRPPVAEELTLSVDDEGVPRIAPWPEHGELAHRPELIQGPTILRSGQPVALPETGDASPEFALPADPEHPAGEPGPTPAAKRKRHDRGAEEHPDHADRTDVPEADAEPGADAGSTVAVGQDAKGRLILASASGTSPAGVAQAMADAGAVDALLLTHAPTPETGKARFFQLVGDKLFQSDRPLGRKEPADLRPRAGGVLVFTPRTLPPRARVVTTFQGQVDVSESSAK